MRLDYLDFEFSEDGDGHGCLDALASVAPAQWPALLAEAGRVLAWAHANFPGARAAPEDGGEWDYALQAVREVPTPLDLGFDEATGRITGQDGAPGQPGLTLGLTLTGSAAFCEALREAFGVP